MDPETRERLDMLVRAREWQSQYPKKADELRRIVLRRIYSDMRTEERTEMMTLAQVVAEANARLRELEGQA